MDVDLKPEGEEEKIKAVKGPVFSVEVILSQKAKDKMAALNESSMTSKAEVLGKEKVKYDNALQSCFDQFGVMNNTVLASCKEGVSSEFKGTEREHLEAPKLEGLVDIEGSYVR